MGKILSRPIPLRSQWKNVYVHQLGDVAVFGLRILIGIVQNTFELIANASWVLIIKEKSMDSYNSNLESKEASW